MEQMTGKGLHVRRLEALMQTPAMDNGQAVRTYNRTAICVMCDAEAPDGQPVTHARPNCQVEYEHLMGMAGYLLHAGIKPVLEAAPNAQAATA